jgi:hypothetical protein
MPAGTAAEDSAVFLAVDVDRAERWCGQRSEHARMGGDGIGNALAATQPGADELVGVSPVDLGTGRTLGGTASLARDGQDPAGLVDGGVAVQQFPGGAVDVIDAATQQNRLQAAARVPSGARGDGGSGQRLYSSRRALAGGGGRAEASPSQAQKYRVR